MCLFSSDFLFIHIPKTGGNSIKTMMENAYRRSGRTVYILNERFDNPHILLSQIPFPIGNRFTFCIVRNPWKQRVSMYLYNLRKNIIPKNRCFREFLTEDKKDFSISEFLQSGMFDAIYTIENFQEMMADLQSRFNIRFNEMVHSNRSESYDYRSYYSPELYKFVEDKERYLLERFDYENIC